MSEDKNTTRQYNAEVNAAAKWWADQLRSKEAPSRHVDYKPKTWQGAFEEALIVTSAKASDYPAELVDKFEQKLRRVLQLRILIERLTHQWYMDTFPHIEFSPFKLSIGVACDYGPDIWLKCAAHYAMLGNLGPHLPFKTAMQIGSGSVVVKEGYGAEWVQLYSEGGE